MACVIILFGFFVEKKSDSDKLLLLVFLQFQNL